MELTATQYDALVELLNIGFGRAGGVAVRADRPPRAARGAAGVDPPDRRAGQALRPLLSDDVASVHQIFSGPVGGDALLILDYAAAGSLKELLTNEPALPLPIDASAREVLTEVGNILLNACLGTFGNLLQVQVSFSVPHLNLDTLHHVLQSLLINSEGLRYALVVQAGFKLRTPRSRATWSSC